MYNHMCHYLPCLLTLIATDYFVIATLIMIGRTFGPLGFGVGFEAAICSTALLPQRRYRVEHVLFDPDLVLALIYHWVVLLAA